MERAGTMVATKLSGSLTLALLVATRSASAEVPGAAPASPPAYAAESVAAPPQDATEPPPPPEVGLGAQVRSPVDERYLAARVTFDRGVAFFESGNYDAALVEFERTYEELSGHPRRYFVLDNIGQCHERLFRYDLALSYYRTYLNEGGPSAEDRAAVEASIRVLEGLLATLSLSSNVRADVWVDDRRVGSAPGVVLIPAGRHVVELRAPGHESIKREVSLSARQKLELDLVLPALERKAGLHPAYFWSGLALTSAAALGGAYFGVRARQRHDELSDKRTSCGAICLLPSEREDVRRLAVTADVFFSGAAVLGVGTALVYFMTDFAGDARTEGTVTVARRSFVVEPGVAWGRDGDAELGLFLTRGF